MQRQHYPKLWCNTKDKTILIPDIILFWHINAKFNIFFLVHNDTLMYNSLLHKADITANLFY